MTEINNKTPNNSIRIAKGAQGRKHPSGGGGQDQTSKHVHHKRTVENGGDLLANSQAALAALNAAKIAAGGAVGGTIAASVADFTKNHRNEVAGLVEAILRKEFGMPFGGGVASLRYLSNPQLELAMNAFENASKKRK